VTAVAYPPPPSDRKEENEKPGGYPIPKDIKDRVDRGREAMRKDANLRRLCHKMWAGEHYWYLNVQGALKVLSTALVDMSGGKPAHRIRNTYNFLQAIVEAKTSAATSRQPGYEIDPSSADLEDVAAARIAEQVAIYGYDRWHLRLARTKVFTLAFVQREGFAMPYFDPGVGPYLPGPDGKLRGLGEIKVRTYSRSQVMWEPGMEFDDSPWHAIDEAMPVDDIKRIPGYVGGKLVPDAMTVELPSERRSDKMARLTTYLERPCEKYPNGRRCFLANGRIVVDFREDPASQEGADWWEDYPYTDANGVVCDEPVIHRISYTVNPEGDDFGLVERLIDLMRTIDDCWNKLLEWKNRCLMPRRNAPRSINATPTNDVPGGTDWYTIDPLNPDAKPEWEKTPPVPRELFDMLNLAIEQMRALAADVDVQPDPRLTSQTANVAVQQATSRWDSFLGDAEEFDSRLMRHCLCLVARYYAEQRIVDIRGRYGWEPPIAFTGSDLRSQVNVRVMEGSLRTKSRAQTMQDIQFMQQNFPGALNPEAVWAALHGGSGEGLLRTWQLDVAKANDVCVRLKDGPEAAAAFGWRQDMDFGDPALGFMVPGWMPRKVDNVAIWKQVFGDFMKNDFFARLPPETQHIYDLVFDALEEQEQQRKLKLVQQEQGVAAQLGMGNAARPQPEIPLPQAGPLSAAQASPSATTPNQ
jgi:hypothetical protein